MFEIFKIFKTTVEFTFTTQEVNAHSPQTSCSVFDWKCPFWINLVQKLKIMRFSKLTQKTQNYQIWYIN